jgi:hypothetical protein
MKTVTIANIVVDLTLINDSKETGKVYEGKRNNTEVTVIEPIEGAPWAIGSSTDEEEANYIVSMHNGKDMRSPRAGLHTFIINNL